VEIDTQTADLSAADQQKIQILEQKAKTAAE
jgi:hypothetical protein